MFHSINQQGYFQLGKTEVSSHYEIKNNQRGILSLTLSNFANMFPMAHPIDNLTSLTTDIRTGKIYQLKDLFKPNSPYVERISEHIKVQIKQRNLPLFKEFESIRPNQDFHIADKALIIFFQRYEIGPRPLGYPMFPISIYDLEDIIEEEGRLEL
ncbi:RsiV family protein [Ectobacillus panaciterrae]|uniref:RsiV family protein n=1 Tax=Ectobacillus panaciterrae TaxID=363872 RepID=UPI001FE1862E|nr:RsiV family protein [Ectobacillus panaciterrae]